MVERGVAPTTTVIRMYAEDRIHTMGPSSTCIAHSRPCCRSIAEVAFPAAEAWPPESPSASSADAAPALALEVPTMAATSAKWVSFSAASSCTSSTLQTACRTLPSTLSRTERQYMMCIRMSVSSWCVATTETVHGSAGRMPQKVVKQYEPSLADEPSKNSSRWGSRTALATCVSHSEVTTKSSEVNDLSRLEQARVAKVPPEWVMSSTGEFLNDLEPSKNWKPSCGMGKAWPSSPSSLLAEMQTMLSLGMTRCRSAANCSPTQSETSQPVMSRSTEPSCVLASCSSSRLRSRETSVQAEKRLIELEGISQSFCIVRSTCGMEAMSWPTESESGSGGMGMISGLPSSCSTRRSSGLRFICAFSMYEVALRIECPPVPKFISSM